MRLICYQTSLSRDMAAMSGGDDQLEVFIHSSFISTIKGSQLGRNTHEAQALQVVCVVGWQGGQNSQGSVHFTKSTHRLSVQHLIIAGSPALCLCGFFCCPFGSLLYSFRSNLLGISFMKWDHLPVLCFTASLIHFSFRASLFSSVIVTKQDLFPWFATQNT